MSVPEKRPFRRTRNSVERPSVKRAVRASDLRPTPAQLLAALARIGREMGR